MREKLFEVIEPAKEHNSLSAVYDGFMILTIFLSIFPLCFKNTNSMMITVDAICLVIFIIDYILRWITADLKFKKKTWLSFVRYPFSAFAIIDLLAILPSLSIINSGFRILKIFRMIRAFRVFKMFRYSKSFRIVMSVLRNSKESLIAVCTLAIGYIVVSALVVFNVEPESFGSFFDAIYWATVSLTTVGYGDIYAVTTIGRVVTMFSSIFGIAIVALPAGIITAGYMNEINKKEDQTEKTEK